MAIHPPLFDPSDQRRLSNPPPGADDGPVAFRNDGQRLLLRLMQDHWPTVAIRLTVDNQILHELNRMI